MTTLDIDPDHTRALAHDVRVRANDASLAKLPPMCCPSSPPTAALAASAQAAFEAVTRRSDIISAHLHALATDADTFVDQAAAADATLARSWESLS